jgi:hypothetical protein
MTGPKLRELTNLRELSISQLAEITGVKHGPARLRNPVSSRRP